MYLPSLQDALDIVQTNDAFIHRAMRTHNAVIHDFSYSLPSNSDFMSPISGRDIDALELRGLTFVEYDNGTVDRFLALRKAFSYEANPSTLHKVLEGKTIISGSEKLDGSLARFIRVNGQVRARTQKRILAHEGDTWADGSPLGSAPHTVLIQNLYETNEDLRNFVNHCLDNNIAAMFEYQDPEFQIVVKPEEISLRLIQARDEATGDYLDLNQFEGMIEITPQMKQEELNLNVLKEMRENIIGIEGWVINVEGVLVKIKTKWYDILHDLYFEGRINNKTLLEGLITGHIDDALSYMGENHKDYARVFAFQETIGPRIAHYERTLFNFIKAHAEDVHDPQKRKDLAISADQNTKPWIGMALRYGRESDDAIKDIIRENTKTSYRNNKTADEFIKRLNAMSL